LIISNVTTTTGALTQPTLQQVGYLFGPLLEFGIAVLAVVVAELLLYRYFKALEKPQLEIKQVQNGSELGWCLVIKRRAAHYPTVTCNDTEYILQRRDKPAPDPIMYVDTPYTFYPFKVSLERNGAISSGSETIHATVTEVKTGTKFDGGVVSMPLSTSGTFEDTVNSHGQLVAWIQFRAEELEELRSYALHASADRLQYNRTNPSRPMSPEDILFIFEEVKEKHKPWWRRLLRF